MEVKGNKSLNVLYLLLLIAILMNFLIIGEIKNIGTRLIGLDVGRYQLFQGSYLDITEDGGVRQDDVFKIDTKTGKTWRYYSDLVTNVDRWMPAGNH